MKNKIISSLFAALVFSSAHADIIELDPLNPDHCRQQILESADYLPVIAGYSSDKYDRVSKAFMEKFEILAKEHPERTFFKWDALKDTLHLTQTLCLQQSGLFIQPNMVLLTLYVFKGRMMMTTPIRLEWSGEMTLAEMNKFIDVSDNKVKQFVLLQKDVIKKL